VSPPEVEVGPRDFPLTRWTRVLEDRNDPELRRALMAELCSSRWRPLYFYARRKGLSADRAEDAVQGLLVELIEHDFLARLDPGRGRLRAYMKRALCHYLENQREHDAAQKRGGGARPLDVSSVEAELAAAGDDPERAFNREWAVGIFEAAFAELEREYASGARRGPFAALRDALAFGEAPAYEELALLHDTSVTALKSWVFRGRKRFRQLVLARIADTVTSGSEAEGELAELLEALRA